jgi:hypothetical protein
MKDEEFEKFTKKIDNPLDDYFWPKTPVELWDTNVRYYMITINDNKKYDLFVINYSAHFYSTVGDKFQFRRFSFNANDRFYHLIQRDSREEILEMFKQKAKN